MAGVSYTGDGTEFVNGVPARDLEAAEWDALDDEQQQAAIDSGLYEVEGAAKSRKPTGQGEALSAEPTPPSGKRSAQPPADDESEAADETPPEGGE